MVCLDARLAVTEMFWEDAAGCTKGGEVLEPRLVRIWNEQYHTTTVAEQAMVSVGNYAAHHVHILSCALDKKRY